MAILKIRDADGNIQEITAIKGESYVLTDEDKQEIADLVKASLGGVDLSNYYTKVETDAKFLTEAQVLNLIQRNMPTSAEGVDY